MSLYEEVKEAYLLKLKEKIDNGALDNLKPSKLIWQINKLMSAKLPKAGVAIINLDLRKVEARQRHVLSLPEEKAEEMRNQALEQANEDRSTDVSSG